MTTPLYPNGDSQFLNEGANMIDANRLRTIVGENINQRTESLNGTLTLEYEIPGIEGLSRKEGTLRLFSGAFRISATHTTRIPLYRFTTQDTDTYSPICKKYTFASSHEASNINYSTNMQLGLHYNHTFANDHNVGSFLIYEENATTPLGWHQRIPRAVRRF